MKIFLMRHAYAGDYIGKKEDKTPADYKRSLEPEGIDAVQRLGDWLNGYGPPTVIYASPIRRADQTAQILADAVFGDKKRYTTQPNLEIGKPIDMVIQALAKDPTITRALLISHSDTIPPALRRMNLLDNDDVDPIAMCELRILKVGRKSLSWKEQKRVMPSDLGAIDFY